MLITQPNFTWDNKYFVKMMYNVYRHSHSRQCHFGFVYPFPRICGHHYAVHEKM